MTHSPFFPSFGELPRALPIFPLESAVVMPGAELPLNIFEPRYLNMVADALATHHLIGMVQPNPSRHGSPPPIYDSGCAGRITAYNETKDGRILLSLTGVCRFDVQEELVTTRGYRIVVPDWRRFERDLAEEDHDVAQDRLRFLGLLRQYFRRYNLETDWEALELMPPVQLVHTLTCVLPLDPAEKQVILEAVSPVERADAFLAALELALPQSSRPLRH